MKIMNLDFQMLQVDMGQIVDVSYAVAGGKIYQRCFDKGDGSISYHWAELDDETEFEPWNNLLPQIGKWQQVPWL